MVPSWTRLENPINLTSSDEKGEPNYNESIISLRNRSAANHSSNALLATRALSRAPRHGEHETEVNGNRTTAESSSLSHHQISMPRALPSHQRDFIMTDTISTEDPFEGFEVESGSEKEFLIANLRSDAPEEDVEQFIAAWKPWSLNLSGSVQHWDTTMNQADFEETVRTALVSNILFGSQDWQEFKFLQDASVAEIDARIYELILTEQDENGQTPLPSLEYPAPYLILQKKVEEFAQSHVFSVDKHAKHTTLQRRDFARDIYDYARAVGMGRYQAKIEVQRARAAYRRDRGMVGGLLLDESDDESTLGLEINDAAEYIAAMTNGMQHGPVDPAVALEEIKRLQAKGFSYETSTKKRKRAIPESRSVDISVVAPEVTSGNANRKALKRLERRERRRLEKTKMKSGLNLGQSEGSMKIKSEGKFSSRLSSNPMRLQPGIKDLTSPVQDLLNAPGDVNTTGSPAKEERKVGLMGHKDMNGLKKVDEASWDLRQKKKKKRKRKPADHLSKSDDLLDAEGIVMSPQGEINSTFIQLGEGLKRINHLSDAGAGMIAKDTAEVNKRTPAENRTGQALSEMAHTNLDTRMPGRREKRKRAVKVNHKYSAEGLIGDLKDHHS